MSFLVIVNGTFKNVKRFYQGEVPDRDLQSNKLRLDGFEN